MMRQETERRVLEMFQSLKLKTFPTIAETLKINGILRKYPPKSSKRICIDCGGRCCSQPFDAVRLTRTEAEKLKDRANIISNGRPGGYSLKFDKDDHCPFFQNGLCEIYEDRPLECQRFFCAICGIRSDGTVTYWLSQFPEVLSFLEERGEVPIAYLMDKGNSLLKSLWLLAKAKIKSMFIRRRYYGVGECSEPRESTEAAMDFYG